MDFFGNILPFLIFIIFAISKAKRREAQAGRKTEAPVGSSPEKKTVSPLSRMDEIRKMGEQFGNTLRKEFQHSVEDQNNKETMFIEDEDEEETIAHYNEKPTNEFTQKLDTPGVQEKNEIGDVIKSREIGGRRASLDKQSILNGVIMAEVLGRPKALRR